MEKKTIEVAVGKKVTDADKKAGEGKYKEVMGMSVPPAEGEVTGRAGYVWAQDPWCGAWNWVQENDTKWTWYRCWRCGGLFRV